MIDNETGPSDPQEDIAETNPIASMLFGAMQGNNPKPDTAQGVADLLTATRRFVEERSFSDIGAVYGDNGRFAEVIRYPDGRIEFVGQATIDEQSDRPRFRRGTATMTALDSFIAHVNRFGDSDSAVFACEDRNDPHVLAVLDYHRKDTLAVEGDDAIGSMTHGEYRHGKHRSQFRFPLSPEWTAWHASNGVKMDMATFAAFLEDNVLDIAEVEKVPDSASRFVEQNGGPKAIADWQTLTKLARGLKIDENSTVSEAVTLASGEGELTISNTHDTEVGGVKVKVPTMFFIEIPIFREGAFYRIPVRLRYRKERGGVAFWYEIWRSDRSFMDAFNEAVSRIRAETPAQVFYGNPENI